MENMNNGEVEGTLGSSAQVQSRLVSIVKSLTRTGTNVASAVLGKPGLVKHISPDRPPEHQDGWNFRPDLLPPTY
jgi:hypothetical protein